MRSSCWAMVAVLALPIALSTAQAQSVQATSLAQSLVGDMKVAQETLDRGLSPWESPEGRPQPEPVKALRLELPGSDIWAAFKPVDKALREAYRQQRKSYLEKNAGIIDRRTASAGLDPLRAAITREEDAYPPKLIGMAQRQVGQIDYALRHDEYNAALCILWGMADALGLWDRQAALESAGDRLTTLRARGLGRKSVSAGEAKYTKNQLGALGVMIERAMAWQPTVGLPADELLSARTAAGERPSPHWAVHLDAGDAFTEWREYYMADPGATAWILRRPQYQRALEQTAIDTRDVVPCATAYRDWQRTLGDYRWGWLEYTRSAANGTWRPHGDWRDLEPYTFWPGAKGSQTAGGL